MDMPDLTKSDNKKIGMWGKTQSIYGFVCSMSFSCSLQLVLTKKILL